MNKYDISHISHFIDTDRSFYIVDIASIRNQLDQWNQYFPNVTPFYAVKCNPDLNILKTLSQYGCSFDCASIEEIDLVLPLVSSCDQIIFSNPVKSISSIIYARDNNINRLTIDNIEELQKIITYHPKSQVFVRIITDDSMSVCPLSNKYGCTYEECIDIFKYGQQFECSIVGLNFHVGSNCGSSDPYIKAINTCKKLLGISSYYGHTINIIDIGGGWNPIHPNFPIMANQVFTYLTCTFDESIQLISEPGRFFVCKCASLVCKIIGKRKRINGITTTFDYYINDSIYSSFNCILFDHYTPDILYDYETCNRSHYTSNIFGQTCDGLDCIYSKINLPEFNINDILIFKNMGAYTICASSTFNGFPLASCIYVSSK